jgi:hypothetical protein
MSLSKSQKLELKNRKKALEFAKLNQECCDLVIGDFIYNNWKVIDVYSFKTTKYSFNAFAAQKDYEIVIVYGDIYFLDDLNNALKSHAKTHKNLAFKIAKYKSSDFASLIKDSNYPILEMFQAAKILNIKEDDILSSLRYDKEKDFNPEHAIFADEYTNVESIINILYDNRADQSDYLEENKNQLEFIDESVLMKPFDFILNLAKTFYNRVTLNHLKDDTKIILTGYAVGATVAQSTGRSLKPKLNDNKLEIYAFECPGLLNDFRLTYEDMLISSKLNIYNTAPNYFNAMGVQVKKPKYNFYI